MDMYVRRRGGALLHREAEVRPKKEETLVPYLGINLTRHEWTWSMDEQAGHTMLRVTNAMAGKKNHALQVFSVLYNH